MPQLIASPQSTAAAHQLASARAQTHAAALVARAGARAYTTAQTPLQQAQFDATARARKVASREPNLITSFALSAEIEVIAQDASHHFAAGDTAAYAALYAITRRLTALIPV